MAVAGHALTVDPGFHDPETNQVVEADEVGGIAGAEESAAESVMLDRIEARGAEDVKEGDAVGDGAGPRVAPAVSKLVAGTQEGMPKWILQGVWAANFCM